MFKEFDSIFQEFNSILQYYLTLRLAGVLNFKIRTRRCQFVTIHFSCCRIILTGQNELFPRDI